MFLFFYFFYFFMGRECKCWFRLSESVPFKQNFWEVANFLAQSLRIDWDINLIIWHHKKLFYLFTISFYKSPDNSIFLLLHLNIIFLLIFYYFFPTSLYLSLKTTSKPKTPATSTATHNHIHLHYPPTTITAT